MNFNMVSRYSIYAQLLRIRHQHIEVNSRTQLRSFVRACCPLSPGSSREPGAST
jgi:hypothetical protein